MIQLDTQALLWLSLQPERLSLRARDAIAAAARFQEGLAISAITLWEIAQLVHRGRVRLLTPIKQFLQGIENELVVLPITVQIALRAAEFPPPFPKDPMDRLIAATALTTNRTLITDDRLILASKACKLLW